MESAALLVVFDKPKDVDVVALLVVVRDVVVLANRVEPVLDDTVLLLR